MVPTAAAITLAAHAIGNAVLLHVIFSPLLEYDSVVMVSLDYEGCQDIILTYVAILVTNIKSSSTSYLCIEQAHTDPSDIIKTAFPLNHLCHFVALSCACPILITWACRRAIRIARNNEIHEQSHKYLNLVNTLLLIGLATIFTQCSFLLCGIHPTQLPIHSFISALYVVTKTVLPLTLPTPAWGGEVVASTLHHDGNPKMKNSIAQLKEVAAYLFGPISSNNKHKQSTHQQQQVQRVHQFQRRL
jgi:hypothetical protein